MKLEQIRIDLKSILYKNESTAINARFKESWLSSNGYDQHIKTILQLINDTFPNHSFDFREIIKIFMFDKVYIPICHTCKNTIYPYKWVKKDWSKYCSMKCCQNDPEVKAAMLKGQESVDWSEKVSKRENTMLDKYGVIAHSQLDESRESLSIRSTEMWKDESKKEQAKIVRANTNLEKYGVEVISQDPERQREMVAKATATKNSKSDEEKQERIEKYRFSRMGEEKFNLMNSYDFIYQKYCVEKLRIAQLSEDYDVSWDALKYALQKHNIEFDVNRENSNRSAIEIDLFNFVSSISENCVHTYKVTGSRKTLDIYVPGKNIGIEFNGVYWHSELCCSKNSHKEKLEFFNSKGIRMIQIWEDDWRNKRTVVEKFLTNLLSENQKSRIGARKTKVIEISQTQYDNFMNDHHMLGTTNTKHRIALEFEEKIVAVMGFNKIAENNKNNDNGFELCRFANTNVTGAFSKLLSYFEDKYNPKLIKSFADLELVDSTCNVYVKNGFISKKVILPDYKYYNRKKKVREHKYNWRKKAFSKLGYDTDNKTEHELAREIGLLRCYDSGKILYEKTY